MLVYFSYNESRNTVESFSWVSSAFSEMTNKVTAAVQNGGKYSPGINIWRTIMFILNAFIDKYKKNL